MLIVDSQIHIWGPDTPERPWKKGAASHRDTPLGMDEVLGAMDGAGVRRAVIVPPRLEGGRNDLALQAAQAHPDRFAVMGKLDFNAPDSRSRLATWKNQPGMLGLRINFKTELRSLPTDSSMDWVWLEAEKAALPIYVSVSQADSASLAVIAERHPGLPLAIDHLGLTSGTRDEDAFRNLARLLALARFGNVAVKVSALPCFTADDYPYRKLHPYLRQVYEAFGPRRMFWGSDLSRLRGPYSECVTMFTREMPWLSEDDLEWIMGRGLCEWLGWKM